jgi:hypothetical protein
MSWHDFSACSNGYANFELEALQTLLFFTSQLFVFSSALFFTANAFYNHSMQNLGTVAIDPL